MESRRAHDRHGESHEDPDSESYHLSARVPFHRPRPSEQWLALGSTPDLTPEMPPQLEVTPPNASHQSGRKTPIARPYDDDDVSDDSDERPFASIGLGIGRDSSPRNPAGADGLSPPEILFSQGSPGFSSAPPTPYNARSHDFLLARPGSGDHHPSPEYHSPHPSALHLDPRSPYGYAPQPPGPPPRSGERDWSWLWTWLGPSWVMYEMLVIGIILAVAHHVFYSRLDGQPADDQLEMLRYGNFLSYAAKSFLTTAIIFAYKQQIWATVRRKSLQLGTIDSLFAAVDDIRAMANWEFARKAKVALGLATIVWLFPLTVILTPATLTVAPRIETLTDKCASVRTLNFEAEKAKNWRNPDKIDGRPGLSLSLWNCTLPMSGDNLSPYNETFFDYWTSSSWQVDLVAALSAYGSRVVPRENVATETCGAGWNCSYTISFTGPGYKCGEVARGRGDNTNKLAELGAPFNTRYLLPDGDFAYVAHTTLGDYSLVQIEAEPGGVPKDVEPPFPKNLGAWRTEPVLWIGHSDWEGDGPVPASRADAKNWNTSFVPTIFRCEHYVTDYTVQFNHTLSDQVTTVLNRTYLHPIVDTTFVPGKDADDGTKDNVTAIPEENYISPLDVPAYRLAGAYHSLGSNLRAVINGTIQYTPWIVADTEAMKTTLINKSTYLVSDNFMSRIQSFYEKMLLSLLSNPQFIIVSWAADPSRRSGIGNSSTANREDLRYPCTRTRLVNAYAYRARDLWIVYAIAIIAAMVSVAFGAAALAQNNYHVRDTTMSSIVGATRAPGLEQLPWKASKWGEVPGEIRKVRMGYGIVTDDYHPGHHDGESESFASPGLGARVSEYDDSGHRLGLAPSLASTSNARVYYGFAPEEFFRRRAGGDGGEGESGTDFKKEAKKVWTFKSWEPPR
ncbi:hypothetical protein B0H66DRAFT_555941 [Apodospora peruviana]|uniref:Formylmethionine deformylase-like protein n=1 Tax=Apodospora peruviana TaxID=516989 RepID=A0AAE0I491_9PEZI|nr:hypothetical protein B0H66DRAFT_555941 [Apodospora peruviana]